MKKRVALYLVLILGFMFLSVAFAQSPSPSVTTTTVMAAPVIAAPVAAAPVGFFAFVKANLAAIALVVYAILDVTILAIPSLSGNGLAHQILLMAAKLAGQNPPAS